MVKAARIAALGCALATLASSALATPPPVIRESVAVCDPNSPANCLSPSSKGGQPITPSGSTSTVVGSTVTTHLTFQTALAASSARVGCTLQNTSSDVEYVYVGATAGASVGASLRLAPGQAVVCATAGVVLTDNLAITSSTTDGAAYTVVSQ